MLRAGKLVPGKQSCATFRMRVARSSCGRIVNRVNATAANATRVLDAVRTPLRANNTTVLPAVTG